MEYARRCQRRQTNGQNFMQRGFRSSQPRCTRHNSQGRSQPVDPGRILVAPSRSHRAFVRARLFDLASHRVQIVGSRDHGEQQDQHATQRQQALQRRECLLPRPTRSPAPPQPVRRQSQQNPCEIEQKLHALKNLPEMRRTNARPSQPVFQKSQIQVNVTRVLSRDKGGDVHNPRFRSPIQ